MNTQSKSVYAWRSTCLFSSLVTSLRVGALLHAIVGRNIVLDAWFSSDELFCIASCTWCNLAASEVLISLMTKPRLTLWPNRMLTQLMWQNLHVILPTNMQVAQSRRLGGTWYHSPLIGTHNAGCILLLQYQIANG